MAKMKPKELSQDEDIGDDVKTSYTDTKTAADRRRSTAGALQKIGKLFLTWDSDPAFKRSTRRAANALKQLTQVPLTAANVNWMFEQSLRQALQAAIVEEAQFDSDRPENGDGMAAGYLKEPSADFQTNQEVRAIILAAARTDASEEDVKRVTSALKNLGEN